MQMDVRQNLQLYKDMIQWGRCTCGPTMTAASLCSNCPEEEVLAQVF